MNADQDPKQIQQQVYALLLEHRYYSEQIAQPLVALQQNYVARTLRVRQSDVSNALRALQRAKLIEKCGQPQMGRPQIYVLTDAETIDKRPDTKDKMTTIRPDIWPDEQEIRSRRIAWPNRRKDGRYEYS